jgi:hypothetical protein
LAERRLDKLDFNKVALMYYPSRELFVKMSESKYFLDSFDDKINSIVHNQVLLTLGSGEGWNHSKER